VTSSLIPTSIPPGPLFSIINRARVIFLNERLKPYALSAGQYPVFMCLLHHPNIIQESMARYFHLDKGTIARTVKKMEDAGYVSKNVDPDNRRAFRLFLTEKGYQVAPEIIAIDREWEKLVTNSISDKEQQDMLFLLRKVAESSILAIKDVEG
jgi:DNA-binding MarR family transcriptional regulator